MSFHTFQLSSNMNMNESENVNDMPCDPELLKLNGALCKYCNWTFWRGAPAGPCKVEGCATSLRDLDGATLQGERDASEVKRTSTSTS